MSTKTEIMEMAQRVLDELGTYISDAETGRGRVLVQKDAGELARELGLERHVRCGGLNIESLPSILGPYLSNTQHMHHPGYIGHQVAVPHRASGIADMIHGFINNPMAIYEMGPSAATIERVIVNWMLEKIGWFHGGGLTDFNERSGNGTGVLTHGGSLANLTALLAARAAAFPDAWDEGVPTNAAVIVPKTAHYSLARAISISGVGQRAIYAAPVTEMEVLRPEELEGTYQRAIEDGRRVFMVSANACATSTGLYDPVDEVADFCERHNLWLHIDGAHGASALLSEKERPLIKGVHRADSIIWDAHKMMRTSSLCAAALFKRPEDLSNAFKQEGSYLFHDKDQPGFDVMPFAVECTKSGLGAKIFWVLAVEGEKGLGDFVQKQHEDTREFHKLISHQPNFACPYVPQSNILCFRYTGINTDDAQLSIRKELLRRGNFYVTTAEVSGKRYLRLAVMNPLTSVNTISALLEQIEDIASGLDESAT